MQAAPSKMGWRSFTRMSGRVATEGHRLKANCCCMRFGIPIKETKRPMNSKKRTAKATRERMAKVCCAIGGCLLAGSSQAAFHLWNIHEVYTDNSGTFQFFELLCPFSSQTFTAGQSIQVGNGVATNTFVIPGNLSSDSLNRAWLFGTAGIHAAGAPTPDFIIPNNFLFASGGTINFFGANSGAYTALPTDGTLSRTWGGGNAVNTPQNFAGQTGQVIVPEPGAVSLLALGAVAALGALRKRKG